MPLSKFYLLTFGVSHFILVSDGDRNMTTHKDYESLKAESRLMGEESDCAVVAVAAACRIPYYVAHAALKAKGRKDRDGTSFYVITAPTVFALGFDLKAESYPKQPNGRAYTPKTIAKKCRTGHWLCRTSGHIFAVVNGKVVDWAASTNKRVTHVYKVVKTREKGATNV